MLRINVPLVNDVFSYFEYPDEIHPMKHFAKGLKERGMAGVKVSS